MFFFFKHFFSSGKEDDEGESHSQKHMAYELNNGYARPPDWWIQQTGLCRANSIFAKNKYLFLQKDEIQLWIDSHRVSAVAQPLIVFKVSCSHKNSKTDNKNEHELLSCHEMQQNLDLWLLHAAIPWLCMGSMLCNAGRISSQRLLHPGNKAFVIQCQWSVKKRRKSAQRWETWLKHFPRVKT